MSGQYVSVFPEVYDAVQVVKANMGPALKFFEEHDITYRFCGEEIKFISGGLMQYGTFNDWVIVSHLGKVSILSDASFKQLFKEKK